MFNDQIKVAVLDLEFVDIGTDRVCFFFTQHHWLTFLLLTCSRLALRFREAPARKDDHDTPRCPPGEPVLLMIPRQTTGRQGIW